jgi:hypothetical protein
LFVCFLPLIHSSSLHSTRVLDDDDDDSWYKDGIPLMSDGGVSHQPGLWGGKISSTQVKLNITQDMNGVKIACQGTNEALQRSINEAIELQVLCKFCEREN